MQRFDFGMFLNELKKQRAVDVFFFEPPFPGVLIFDLF